MRPQTIQPFHKIGALGERGLHEHRFLGHSLSQPQLAAPKAVYSVVGIAALIGQIGAAQTRAIRAHRWDHPPVTVECLHENLTYVMSGPHRASAHADGALPPWGGGPA